MVWNTVFNITNVVVSAAVNFYLIRYLVGGLGQERFGIWMLVASIFSYRGLLTMGLNSSVNRYMPFFLARGEPDEVRRLFGTALLFLTILAVVLALASVIVGFQVDTFFLMDSDLVRPATILILVVGFCHAFSMPLELSSAVLSGLQRYGLLSLAMVSSQLLRVVFVILLLAHGYGLITVGLIFGLTEIGRVFVQMILVRKTFPADTSIFSFGRASFTFLKELLAYGTNALMYTMGVVIFFKASDIVIAVFLGPSDVAKFAVATAGVMLVVQLLQAFTRAIFPAVSDLDGRDDQQKIREISLLSQKYSLLLLIPAGCFLLVMGAQFLDVWVGEKFEDPAALAQMSTVLAILTVGHCLRLAQHSNFLVLVGRGEHRIFGLLTALTAGVAVFASVVALKVLHLDIVAVAWANTIPLAFVSGVLLTGYFSYKMQIPLTQTFRQVVCPALLGSLPAVVSICVWRLLAPPDRWFELAAVVLLAGFLTIAGSWILSFSPLERKRFVNALTWARVRR